MIHPSRKAKIKWQCRRGMLELDLLLERFVNESLDKLTPNQFDTLEKLLSKDDPILYSWLMACDSPKDEELCAIVELIKLHGYIR